MAQFNETLTQQGALFRCIAPYGNSSRSVQQESRSSSHLNSYQCYVVFSENAASGFIWSGQGHHECEQTTARNLLEAFSVKVGQKVDLNEGAETDDFWAALGGKGDYVSSNDQMMNPDFEPMLFEISNLSGYMNMKPVPAFSQQCLLNVDVYLLDCFNTIYIWVGNHSNKFEKKAAYNNAEKYIAALKDGRTKEKVVISEVAPTQEPPMFKIQFPNWSEAYSKKWIVVADPVKGLKEEHPTVAVSSDDLFSGHLDPKLHKFTLADLKG